MYQEKLNLLLHIKITKDKEVSELSRDIRWFRDKYDFLSNSYQAPVTYEGITYDSSECAFQAQKTLDNEVRKTFQHMTPIAAKKAGKSVQLRDKWDDIKGVIMFEIVRQKFLQHPDLAEKLLATGEGYLEDNSSWVGDRYFGVVSGVGENVLGCSLMIVREELKKRKQGIVPKEVHLCNIALIPNFPVYLDNLDLWMKEEYNKEYILHNSNIEVAETEFGTTVRLIDTLACSAHEAFGLLMKCLSLGQYQIKSVEELDKFFETHDQSFLEFLEDAVDDWECVADKLRRTQGYLVHEDEELEEALLMDPEGFVGPWMEEVLFQIKEQGPSDNVDAWGYLVSSMYSKGILIGHDVSATDAFRNLATRESAVKEVCETLVHFGTEEHTDCILDAWDFGWLPQSCVNLRSKLATDLVTRTLSKLT